MTTEGASADPPADTGDGRLFCYRHPDRETWVRCGRCDRPICPRCAMQGPVGFRCKDCGKPAYDPLTSFTPMQAIRGAGVALTGGILVALVASRIGFFSIIISYFAGSFIAEAATRVTGYKRGPRMLTVVLGGIVAGAVIAFGIDYGMLLAEIGAIAAEAGDAMASYPMGSMLLEAGVWALVSAVAACVGAWSRIR